MTILFFARLYAPHVGGVETHLENVAKILSQKHRVIVVTEKYDASLPEHEVMNGKIEVWRIPVENSGENSASKKFAIWWWLLKHFSLFLEADIIHIHDVFFWILPFYPLLFWKKISITFHGYEAPGPLTEKQIFWHQFAAKLTRGNICIGDFHRKWYGVSPTIVSYGGVSELPRIAEKISPKNPSKIPKIIFAARLANDTGILEYLKAVKILKENGRNFQLDVYGDGELRKKCEEFVAQNSLQENVHFHGFVAEATKYFSGVQIIFASQYLTILEALKSKSQVISFADTLIKEDYLQMTPFSNWISITHSANEIAEEAEKIVSEKNAAKNSQKIVQKAYEWASQQTWQKLADQYETLWSQK